jgi:uncharacterized membrane protein YgcG
MSLINEALKRAKQTQKENPPPPSALQFKAADPSQQRDSGPPIVLIVAVIVVVVVVGAFVMIGLQKRGAASIVNAKQAERRALANRRAFSRDPSGETRQRARASACDESIPGYSVCRSEYRRGDRGSRFVNECRDRRR